MNHSPKKTKAATAKMRILVSGVIGVVVASGLVVAGLAKVAPLVSWDAAALVYVIWVWLTIWPREAGPTAELAGREDPSRTLADGLLIGASLASLVAVGFVVAEASSATGAAKGLEAALTIISVLASWSVVHTVFTLKYAELYYGQPAGGIDFNQDARPKYSDFAYMAFTIGMTFQVSDTDLKTPQIRTTALKHAILSYLFGTVIIATTINTIVGLSQ